VAHPVVPPARPPIVDRANAKGDSLSKSLSDLYEEVKDCQKCSLWKTRTQTVFGVGNENAEILLVGEAPGYYEDKQGEPFVGAAGKLLDELLASIGLNREKVYITNILKSRPPGNRDPLPEEIEACKPYLIEQIKIINPAVIVSLGAFASRVLLEKNISMKQVHGRGFWVKEHNVFPIYHPAAALHSPNTKETLEQDFLALKDFLSEGTNKETKPPEEPAQTSLF